MSDHASKLKGLTWLVGVCALGVVFAVGLSPLIRAIPWSWEQKLSAYLIPEMPKTACLGDVKSEALLKRLVNRLYPLDADDAAFSITVQIVDDPTVNAFAELGGKISVNKGLLDEAKSPEEIAGVLAHEIQHVRRRHILEGAFIRMMTGEGLRLIFSSDPESSTEWTNYFLTMGFSRAQEAEADEGGLERLQKAHIDNHGFSEFFRRMEKLSSVPVFVSDHPSNHARAAMIGKFSNDNTKPIMSRAEWLAFKDYCQ